MRKLAPITTRNKNIVKAASNRKYISWTPSEREAAIQLYAKGYSIKGIASILGRSEHGVKGIVYRRRTLKI